MRLYAPGYQTALAALQAQAILRVLHGPHQHYATEYAIDLSRLPARVPYRAHATGSNTIAKDGITVTVQGTNNLSPGDERPFIQPVKELPAGESGGKPVSPSRQMAIPQVAGVQEKTFFLPDESTSPQPGTSRGYRAPSTPHPRSIPRRPPETPAPETLFITDALRRWAAETVPGISLDHERDKFLCYARARGLTNVDWSEALKFWWLEAHARAVRRGTLHLPAVPAPTLAPELPPLYDVELHAQMQADIARLCGPTEPSMSGMNDHEESRRRRVSSILAVEDVVRERDPAYLAVMRARKAVLQAQATLLQTQQAELEAVSAAD